MYEYLTITISEGPWTLFSPASPAAATCLSATLCSTLLLQTGCGSPYHTHVLGLPCLACLDCLDGHEHEQVCACRPIGRIDGLLLLPYHVRTFSSSLTFPQSRFWALPWPGSDLRLPPSLLPQAMHSQATREEGRRQRASRLAEKITRAPEDPNSSRPAVPHLEASPLGLFCIWTT